MATCGGLPGVGSGTTIFGGLAVLSSSAGGGSGAINVSPTLTLSADATDAESNEPARARNDSLNPRE